MNKQERIRHILSQGAPSRRLWGFILSISLTLFQTLLTPAAFPENESSLPLPEPAMTQSVPDFVPGRLIVKLKTVENPVAMAEGKERLDRLFSQFGVIRMEPLFKESLPVWEKHLKTVEGPTTRERSGWYWYMSEKDWMPKESGSTGDSSVQEEQDRMNRVATAALEEFHLQNIQVLDLPEKSDILEAARVFAADPMVEYAHPDYLTHLKVLTNDRFVSVDENGDGVGDRKNWKTNGWGQGNLYADQWGAKIIGANLGWDTLKGIKVSVAVLDSGIDYGHEDLVGNIALNLGEMGTDGTGRDKRTNGRDDDGNGYVDDWRGWNFVPGDWITYPDGHNDPMDDHGHGTFVAGIIAAKGDNVRGMAGIASRAAVRAIKTHKSQGGSGDVDDICKAIVYAVNQGDRVINASWGQYGEAPRAVIDAIAMAHKAGVVFIAAAGNEDKEVGDVTYGHWPASIPYVFAIGASNSSDYDAFFSNSGWKLDFVAPGGGDVLPTTIYEPIASILSLLSSRANSEFTDSGRLKVETKYARGWGTSYSTAHSSGLMAVMLTEYPKLSPEQARQAMRKGAVDICAPGYDFQSGYGRIDVRKALEEAWKGPLGVKLTWLFDSADPKNRKFLGGTITGVDTIFVEGIVEGPDLVKWELSVAKGASPQEWREWEEVTPATGVDPTKPRNGLLATLDAKTFIGTFALQLVGRKVSGEVYRDFMVFTIAPPPLRPPLRVPDTDTDTNRPPGIALSQSYYSTTEGQNLTFEVIGLDPDGDPITFSTSQLPVGATFDATTHKFSWTPAKGQAGEYTVRFEVKDSHGATGYKEVPIYVLAP